MIDFFKNKTNGIETRTEISIHKRLVYFKRMGYKYLF